MASARGLLSQIEEGALDSETPLADVLRKCVALGGRAGSAELRDWARRELDGYLDEESLPSYRVVPAILAIDGQNLAYRVTGQEISPWQLPEFAREAFKQETRVYFGIAELEKIVVASEDVVKLLDPRMPDLVLYMNTKSDYGTAIHSMYWKVSTTSIHGILDNVRTKLVSLVAEMRAVGADENPTAEATNQAVNVVLHNAKRSTINVNTNQSAAAGGSSHQAITSNPGRNSRRKLPAWVSGPWGFAVGLSTIVAAGAGVAVWLGWNPFD